MQNFFYAILLNCLLDTVQAMQVNPSPGINEQEKIAQFKKSYENQLSTIKTNSESKSYYTIFDVYFDFSNLFEIIKPQLMMRR